jgi:hypothetical protein
MGDPLADLLGTLKDIGSIATGVGATITSIEQLTGSGKTITLTPSISIGSSAASSSASSTKLFGFSPLELGGLAVVGGLAIYGVGKAMSGRKRIRR